MKKVLLIVAAIGLMGQISSGVASRIIRTTYADLGAPADGAVRYCTDCNADDPCSGGGGGAFAFRADGGWLCSGGGTISITSSDGSIVILGNDLTVDDSAFKRFTTGTGAAPGTCTPGSDYVRTDTNRFFSCTSSNNFEEAVLYGDDIELMSTVETDTALVLKPNGSGGVIWTSASSGETYVVKAADESITSDDTLTADNTLVVAISASTKYMFHIEIYYVSDAAADFKFQVDCPASPTKSTGSRYSFAPASTPAGTFFSCATGTISLTHTSGTGGNVKIEMYVSNGSNAGNVSFTWAQNTNNGATTTVSEGSFIRYRVIP